MNDERQLHEMPKKDAQHKAPDLDPQRANPYRDNSPSIRQMQWGHYRAFSRYCDDLGITIAEGMMRMIEAFVRESDLNKIYGTRAKWRKPPE